MNKKPSLWVVAVEGVHPNNFFRDFISDFSISTNWQDAVVAAYAEFARRKPGFTLSLAASSLEITDGLVVEGLDGEHYRIRIERVEKEGTASPHP